MQKVKSLSELKTAGPWYLATPYSKYRRGLFYAYMAAKEISEELSIHGIVHYCPIAASHEWSWKFDVNADDYDFWNEANLIWMKRARGGILVAEMDGWQDSTGIRHELGMFEKWGRPCLLLPLELVVRPLPRSSDWMVESSSVDMKMAG